MKILSRILLILPFLLAACGAPAAGMAQPTQSVLVTGQQELSPSPTAQPYATRTPGALPPTPTAQPLPTRVVKEQPAPTARPGATPEPAKSLLDQYLPENQKVAETEHFVFYAQDGYFPVDQDWWLKQSEVIYDYVSRRVNAQATNKIHIAFMKPDPRACPIRGLASQDNPPTVLIYADQQSPRTYLSGVLAHELGHAIPSEGFSEGLPDDTALAEGLATWASGKYWAAWKDVPSLDDLVRGYVRSGVYESISENYDLHGVYPWQDDKSSNSGDCLARRDKVYSEWGSFLGYLINQYGWDKAHRLFQSPEPVSKDGKTIYFPPDYEGIYSKSLNQLEYDWLQFLKHSTPQQTARMMTR